MYRKLAFSALIILFSLIESVKAQIIPIYNAISEVKYTMDFFGRYSQSDIGNMVPKLIEGLRKNPKHLFKSIPVKDTIRIGIHHYELSNSINSLHFVSDDNIWVDIIVFPDIGTIDKFWDSFNGSQWYCGWRDKNIWVFHTMNSDKNNAVNSVFRKGTVLVNIGISSIPVTPKDKQLGIITPDPEYIFDRIEILQNLLRFIVSHLVDKEDLVMMPSIDGKMSAIQRVTGFVHLWSEVRYNFAFFDKFPQLNWDNVLHRYLIEVEKEQTTAEYYRLLQKCLAMLHDGHTSIFSIPQNTFQFYSPPVRIRLIQGKAIVTDVDFYEENDVLKPGVEVTHIAGKTIHENLEEEVYPYICANTRQDRDNKALGTTCETSFPTLLEGEENSIIKLQLEDLEDITHSIELIRSRRREELPWHWQKRSVIYYKRLSEDISYVALNTFRLEEVVSKFDKILPKIQLSKGLIIDLRENSGGNSSIAYQIIGRLISEPLQNERWKSPQHIPSLKSWGEKQKWYEGEHNPPPVPLLKEPFLGPLVVLIGSITASAAETFLVPLHSSGRAILVGEKTAGSTGNPLIVSLPGGGSAGICTLQSLYPDGSEFVGIGIIPDVQVELTRSDIAKGRDSVLEKGIEVLKSKLN